MRIVIQRVSHASVTIEGEVKSAIRQGYLILLGIEESDTSEDVDWLVRKVIGLRVFDDENHVMNRSIMGPILAMLISIVPSVLITWFAAKMGYQGGHEYLSKLQGGDLMEKLMYVCGIVGLMSVGGMIATLIGATTPLQFAEGTVVIQDILDGMMPQMISLGLTGLMYWLIKKNVNTGWLLVIAIVGGIALSAAGILA